MKKLADKALLPFYCQNTLVALKQYFFIFKQTNKFAFLVIQKFVFFLLKTFLFSFTGKTIIPTVNGHEANNKCRVDVHHTAYTRSHTKGFEFFPCLFSTSSRLLLMGSWIMGSVGEWDQINPI
jgi:hypothetical protein